MFELLAVVIGYAIAGAAFGAGFTATSKLISGSHKDSSGHNEIDESERSRKIAEIESKKKDMERQINYANELLENKNYERARTVFESIIQDAELIGMSSYYKKQLENSIKIVYEKLADLFLEKQAYSDAIECLNNLIKIDGESPHTILKLANIYYVMGNTNQAIEYFEKAIEADKTNRFSYERLAELFEKKGDFHSAQMVYIKAAESNNFDDAFQLHFYKKALSLGKLEAKYKKDAIRVYLKKGMYTECLKLSDELINSEPENFFGFYIKGICLQKLNKITESNESLLRAISMKNSDEDAKYYIALNYYKMKEFDKGLEFIQKIGNTENFKIKKEILKAYIFLDKGNIDISFSIIDKLDDNEIKKELQKYELKDFIELLVNQSVHYKKLKDESKAELCIKRAQNLDKRIYDELSNPKKAGLMETFWDKYSFINELGVGGLGRVILGQEIKTGKKVAIKEILPTLSVDPIVVERFRREVKIMKSLNHPNIIKIYDDALWEDKYLFVMEYIDGVSLTNFVKDRGFIGKEEFLKIVKGLCSALDYIHNHPNKIIHRDLKPDNIFIKSDLSPVISDFGIARMSASSSSSSSMLKITKSADFIGTPYFSAPEQFFNQKAVDQRTDIYALGCIMYFILVKFPPFLPDEVYKLPLMHRDSPIPNPKEINPNIDDRLVSIINKCLAKNIEERYGSVKDILLEIDEL